MCWRWAQVAVLQTAAGEGNEESGKSVRFSARARSDCWDFSRDGFGVAGVHELCFGPARRFSLFFFFYYHPRKKMNRIQFKFNREKTINAKTYDFIVQSMLCRATGRANV